MMVLRGGTRNIWKLWKEKGKRTVVVGYIYIYTITAGLWDAGFNENESLLLYCMGN